MKRYLVKETSKATDRNENFTGTTAVAWFGKKDERLAYEGDYYRQMLYRERPLAEQTYFVREYGYKRECDARRSWTFRNPENTEYWKSTVEIVEVEV